MHHGLKHAGLEPALSLLINDRPRRKVVWHPAPGRPALDDEAQAIEDLAQIMPTLRGLYRQKRKIGSNEGPLLVAHIRGICFASRLHARNIMLPSVPNSL